MNTKRTTKQAARVGDPVAVEQPNPQQGADSVLLLTLGRVIAGHQTATIAAEVVELLRSMPEEEQVRFLQRVDQQVGQISSYLRTYQEHFRVQR